MTSTFSSYRNIFFAYLLLATSSLSAEEAMVIKLFELPLEDLMKVKVTTTSNKPKPVREQPGVITVITEQEIARSGARFLADILRLVPGFSFNFENFGLHGVSFRGNDGFEGKILLIVDEIEMNELAYGTLSLMNHYSADTIKQLEIIRGPGSVFYGGNAELAVIKITTKGSELKGSTIAARTDYDFRDGNIHNNNYVFMSGDTLDNDFSYSISGFTGRGDYSNHTYNGLLGNSYDQENNSNAEPLNVNFGFSLNDINFRLIYDRHKIEDRIGLGGLGLYQVDVQNPSNSFVEFTETSKTAFKNLSARLNYLWEINEDFTIKPSVTWSKQWPWFVSQSRSSVDSNIEAVRWTYEAIGIYDINSTSNILIGANTWRDKAHVKSNYIYDPSTFFNGDSDSTITDDTSIFFQYEASTDWANLTLGGRYEDHDFAGSQIVPRLAITKVWDKLHAKFVYNEAFKIPYPATIAGQDPASPLKGAEDTTVIETEIGFQLTESVFLQGNVYWMEIKDYIVFNSATISNDSVGDVSTFGGEFMMQLQQPWGHVDIGYSIYQIDSATVDTSTLAIAEDNDALLGIPNHKLTLNIDINLDENASLNVNSAVLGTKYACIEDPIGVCGTPKKLGVEYDFNTFYRQRIESLTYGIGIANIFNSTIVYPQTFRGGAAPTRGLGRRLMLNVDYQF